MNLKKINFVLDNKIHIHILKQVPKYLALGCRDPRGLTVHQQRPRPRKCKIRFTLKKRIYDSDAKLQILMFSLLYCRLSWFAHICVSDA
jgi:hypothetical protein